MQRLAFRARGILLPSMLPAGHAPGGIQGANHLHTSSDGIQPTPPIMHVCLYVCLLDYPPALVNTTLDRRCPAFGAAPPRTAPPFCANATLTIDGVCRGPALTLACSPSRSPPCCPAQQHTPKASACACNRPLSARAHACTHGQAVLLSCQLNPVRDVHLRAHTNRPPLLINGAAPLCSGRPFFVTQPTVPMFSPAQL